MTNANANSTPPPYFRVRVIKATPVSHITTIRRGRGTEYTIQRRHSLNDISRRGDMHIDARGGGHGNKVLKLVVAREHDHKRIHGVFDLDRKSYSSLRADAVCAELVIV